MYALASEWGINSIISCVWALWDIAWLLKYLPGVLHGLQFSGMLLYYGRGSIELSIAY